MPYPRFAEASFGFRIFGDLFCGSQMFSGDLGAEVLENLNNLSETTERWSG
jgi:hypothetical protein